MMEFNHCDFNIHEFRSMEMVYHQRYLMNIDGEIYDVINQRYISKWIDATGYVSCSLIDLTGDRKQYRLHRLIAEMFV